MTQSFSKYSGAGNDFILIDDRARSFLTSAPRIAALCCRRNGVGADGVILLQEEGGRPRMRIFNADGSEAEMCGNGLRCFKKFAMECGFFQNPLEVITMTRLLKVESVKEDVQIEIGEAKILDAQLSLDYEGQSISADFINVAVPHLVCYVEDMDDEKVEKMGHYFRNHPRFKPHGTNVNFVELKGRYPLIRTYERGVEGETWACGTGCAASALSLYLRGIAASTISLKTRGGEILTVDFRKEGDKISDLRLTGPARKIFSGQLNILD